MGRLLMAALEKAGHTVEVASALRAFCRSPDHGCQAARAHEAQQETARLLAAYEAGDPAPDLWFTYHVYYKAPDWIGPAVSGAVGIPYVIAEASHAPKRAHGPWSAGHEAAGRAIAAADVVVNLTRADRICVEPAARPGAMADLPPFLDAAPFAAAFEGRGQVRAALAAQAGLDPEIPWLLSVAMMRPGPKLESYRVLAQALSSLSAVPWRLVVVGEGEMRATVEAEFAAQGDRIAWLGEQPPAALPALYAACDIYAWPAIHEAYGMALLEAQATGLPVVAANVRGVPDVVADGETGCLTEEGDGAAFAGALAALLGDPAKRARMGTAARAKVARRHGLDGASRQLDAILIDAGRRHGAPRAATG